MAALHSCRPDQAGIGTSINNPNVDFTKFAQAFGAWAEGPIADDPAAWDPRRKS